ncbi:MAG: class I SAM-dependent methyltransferase [Anaerolineales bacterium]
MEHKMTVDEAIQQAVDEFPFPGYIKPEKESYSNIPKTVLRYLQPGASILDVGCGPCDKTAVLQFLGFDCSGYDDLQDYWHQIPGNREKILSFAKKCGIDFKLANEDGLPFDENSFDLIMLHDVLEHLHDSPRDMLNDLLELAKPDGLLFITVPSAVNIRKRIDVMFGRTNLPPFEKYYWYPGHWRGHVREYVKSDLASLSEYLNLEVLELRTCDHMLGRRLPRIIHPFYLIVTNIFRGWKDSWLLVARKKKGWSAKKTLPENEIPKIFGTRTSYQYPE